MNLPSTYSKFSKQFNTFSREFDKADRKLEGQGLKIEDLETHLYALVVKNNEL